jgi:hypothetical protein
MNNFFGHDSLRMETNYCFGTITGRDAKKNISLKNIYYELFEPDYRY